VYLLHLLYRKRAILSNGVKEQLFGQSLTPNPLGEPGCPERVEGSNQKPSPIPGARSTGESTAGCSDRNTDAGFAVPLPPDYILRDGLSPTQDEPARRLRLRAAALRKERHYTFL
jgi:hypothetical protein